MNKKYFLAAFILLLFCQQYGICQKLSSKKELKNTKLKAGFTYTPFAVNENYLAWGEFYSGTITIYNLRTNQFDKLKLKKGRGPHEYQIFTAISLTYHNHLLIADPENAKLLDYDISSKKFLTDVVLNDFQPYRISAENNFLYGLNKSFFKNNSLFVVIHPKAKDWKISPIRMTNLKISDEFSYPYSREGFIAVNSHFGIFLSRYYPNLYLSSIEENKFLKKVQFDNWQTKKGEKATMRGKEFYLAPTDVDVKIKDVAFVPGNNHSILILAKGKSEDRSYNHSQLRVFDFRKEEFIGTLDFGFTVDQIVANHEYLFVYSSEKNKIYKSKIEMSE